MQRKPSNNLRDQFVRMDVRREIMMAENISNLTYSYFGQNDKVSHYPERIT